MTLILHIIAWWFGLSFACGLFPFFLNAIGIERPGLIAILAPVLVPVLLVIGVPLLLMEAALQSIGGIFRPKQQGKRTIFA